MHNSGHGMEAGVYPPCDANYCGPAYDSGPAIVGAIAHTNHLPASSSDHRLRGLTLL